MLNRKGVNKKDRVDFKQYRKDKAQKIQQHLTNPNPFLLQIGQPDTGLYKVLFEFEIERELAEYDLPLQSKQPASSQKAPMSQQKSRLSKDPTKISIQKQKEQIELEKQIQEEQQLQSQGLGDEEFEEDYEYDENEEDEQREEQKASQIINHIYDERNKKPPNKIQKAEFVNQAVWQQLQLINTGQEAISFFAKYGNTTPIKFIYCKRAEQQTVIDFRPYDLEVIKLNRNQKELNEAEYYTISAHGIVHVFLPGK